MISLQNKNQTMDTIQTMFIGYNAHLRQIYKMRKKFSLENLKHF